MCRLYFIKNENVWLLSCLFRAHSKKFIIRSQTLVNNTVVCLRVKHFYDQLCHRLNVRSNATKFLISNWFFWVSLNITCRLLLVGVLKHHMCPVQHESLILFNVKEREEV